MSVEPKYGILSTEQQAGFDALLKDMPIYEPKISFPGASPMTLNKQALLIENGQLVADTLRHLADNEIDSDYFAITSTSENGTEIEHELVITDYALQAAGTVDELVKALEAEQGYREGAFVACNRWHDKFREAESLLESEPRTRIEATGITIKGINDES